MPIVLYSHPLSTPSRAAKAVLLLTNTQFEEKNIEVAKGENKTPEFQKINPDEAIPVLQDGTYCLPESGAIVRYVARNSDTLYPKDHKRRAKVDNYLDFHASSMSLITKFAVDYVIAPNLWKRPEPADKEQRFKDVEETLIWFEEIFLGGGKYKYIFDSPTLTIADVKAAIELQGLFIINYDFSKVPHLKQYVERIHKVPEIEQVSQGLYGFMLSVLKIQFNPFLSAIVKLKQQPLQQTALPQLLIQYHLPASPYSRAALSVILGQKIDHQIKLIDVFDNSKNPKEFYDVSPNQTVPAISQGQYNLFESHAIMRYLCDVYNIKDLYPKTNWKLKAKVDEYLDWHQSQGAFGELLVYSLDFYFYPILLKKPEAPNKEQRTKTIDELLAFFIETFLANGKFKYINNLPNVTLADLSASSQLSMLFIVNYNFDKFPVLKQYISVVFADFGIKEANKEYFAFIQSNKVQLSPFIQSIMKPNRKSGCC
ncbi:Glutathione S-transferase theta-1 [Paramecium bursaria]